MLNMVIILIVMYSNVITAIDKIHTYLLCFNKYWCMHTTYMSVGQVWALVLEAWSLKVPVIWTGRHIIVSISHMHAQTIVMSLNTLSNALAPDVFLSREYYSTCLEVLSKCLKKVCNWLWFLKWTCSNYLGGLPSKKTYPGIPSWFMQWATCNTMSLL